MLVVLGTLCWRGTGHIESEYSDVRFSEEVGNVSSGSGKWQVGIRGENGA